MPIVVDDHLLLALLAGVAPREVIGEVDSGGAYTTGCWYYRLARAAASEGTGSLSSRLERLTRAERERVRNDLDELPEGIGLLGWRTVVPIMAALRVRHPLNLLNAEALAVALLTSATLVVTTDSPLLRAGAADVGVECRVRG